MFWVDKDGCWVKNSPIGQGLTKPINRLPFLDQEVKIFPLFQKSCFLDWG